MGAMLSGCWALFCAGSIGAYPDLRHPESEIVYCFRMPR